MVRSVAFIQPAVRPLLAARPIRDTPNRCQGASATVDRQIARQEAAGLPRGQGRRQAVHRLNRHSDRRLNMALDIIVKVRMVPDETTRRCTQRRTGGGQTYLESNAP
jgi:hypothetical protein